MTQKSTVLLLLETRGFKGVGVHELVYEKGITRAAAIVHELRNEGIEIDTIDEGDSKLARYVLKKANVPPAVCRCGHRQRSHLAGSRCLAFVDENVPTKDLVDCDCQVFHAA